MAELKNTSITGDLTVSGNINTQATKLSATLSNLIYPVGSLYWSSKSTDPSQLFEGTTWTQIKDKFIFAQGTKVIDTTGGSETITLTTAQLPSHDHSFSGSSGSAGSHSHSYTAGGTVTSTFTGTAGDTGSGGQHRHTMAHTHDRGDMDITGTFSVFSSSSQPGNYGDGAFYRDGETKEPGESYAWQANCPKWGFKASNTWTGNTSEPSNSYTGYENSHTHSFTPSGTVSSSFTGTPNQSTSEKGSHTHTISGTVGKTGSGSAINIMPPYVVKYCWERTE